MIVNKSMFPIQTGFGVISKMQDRFDTLQMQLGTGEKASTLSEMGRDLPMSLSVRSRLAKIEGFSANIETVKLRLSFLDKTMSRLDAIEGEARNSAVQGQYGTNNINMATLPGLSKARLDEVVTLLNSDVAGRYLFGGANTDSAPLPDTETLLNGQGGKAGFKTVVSERKAADAGLDGRGRLASSQVVGTSTVKLSEDGVHPFGMKVSTISTTSSSVTVTQPTAGTLPLGKEVGVTFATAPAAQIVEGQSISMGFALPDGTETQITLRAVTAAKATGAADEFTIGADAETTATNFKTTLNAKLVHVGKNVLAGASTFAAADNFYNGAGEPVLRVQGPPATATALRVADETDTIMWYSGQSPSVSARGLGRLGVSAAADTVTLTEKAPVSAKHGFQISAVSADTANIDTTYTATNPSSVAVKFNSLPVAGEAVDVTLTDPSGASRTVKLTAVAGKAGPGQFVIGADVNSTAASFSASLTSALSETAATVQGNPRLSVTAQVDDSTRVPYGIEANEMGLLRMVRTLSSLSVETYPDSDTSSKDRFDTMARRQQSELSESHNSEAGSIEILTMELAVAHNALDNSAKRHTDYKSQLDNLLSDVETVSKEEVAMEIMALQTRLQASYQVTSMVSKLSLVKYL